MTDLAPKDAADTSVWAEPLLVWAAAAAAPAVVESAAEEVVES